MNAGNTLGYDAWKTYATRYGLLEEGPVLHLSASIVAAFCSCTFSCPADVVLTRYQSSATGERLMAVLGSIVRTEGLRGFYRGWSVLFIRVAPIYILYLPVFEQIRVLLGLGYMT